MDFPIHKRKIVCALKKDLNKTKFYQCFFLISNNSRYRTRPSVRPSGTVWFPDVWIASLNNPPNPPTHYTSKYWMYHRSPPSRCTQESWKGLWNRPYSFKFPSGFNKQFKKGTCLFSVRERNFFLYLLWLLLFMNRKICHLLAKRHFRYQGWIFLIFWICFFIFMK